MISSTSTSIENASVSVENPGSREDQRSVENTNEETVFGTDCLFVSQEENVDSHVAIVVDEVHLENTWDSGISANLSEDYNTTEIEFIDDHGNKRTAAVIKVIPESDCNTNSNDSLLTPGEEISTQNADLYFCIRNIFYNFVST